MIVSETAFDLVCKNCDFTGTAYSLNGALDMAAAHINYEKITAGPRDWEYPNSTHEVQLNQYTVVRNDY